MSYKNCITKLLIVVIVIMSLNINYILKVLYPFSNQSVINNYSQMYGLDPCLVAALIKTESNFDSKAKSSKNAYGLMQITSTTAKWAAEQMGITNFNVDMLYEPKFNINMGCWYLNNLNKEFSGNMTLVLAAYNGGSGNVQKWLNDAQHSKDGINLHYIPFKETDMYVKKVNVNYNIYLYLYKKK
jgi:soluble lytic murein transglycosylase